MGVELSVYRATVGLHNVHRVLKCSVTTVSATEFYKCTFIYGLIIATLLIAAGIESNPGPITEEDVNIILNSFAEDVGDIIKEKFANERCEYKKDLSILRYQLATLEIQTKKNLDEVTNNLEKVRKENVFLKRKIIELERAQRKNNVIIYGEPEVSPTEECAKTVLKRCKTMNMDVDKGEIQDAYRLGKQKGKRPILCKFANFRKKQEFISKCKQNKDISALHDLSKQDRTDLKKLKPHLDRARQNGHRAIVREGKLVVNSVIIPKELICNEENKSDNAACTPQNSVAVVDAMRRESVSPTQETNSGHIVTSRSPPIPLPRKKHLKKLQTPDDIPLPSHDQEQSLNVSSSTSAAASAVKETKRQFIKPKKCTAALRPPPPPPADPKSYNDDFNADTLFYHGVQHAPFPSEQHELDNSDSDTDTDDNEKYFIWLHNNIENL